MGKMYKEVSENDIIKATKKSTEAYNEQQNYYEDDRTYFEHFAIEREQILESAGGAQKYTTVGLTPDRVYPKLNLNDFFNTLVAEELNDIIDKDAELVYIKTMRNAGEVAIHNERGYASIDFVDSDYSEKTSGQTFVMTVEPTSKQTNSLQDGFEIISWNGDEGIVQKNLKAGLLETQSNIQNFKSERSLQMEQPEPTRSKLRA